MKSRLPLLTALPQRPRAPLDPAPARVRVAQPLICIADDSPRAALFAAAMVRSLRARGCAAEGLLATGGDPLARPVLSEGGAQAGRRGLQLAGSPVALPAGLHAFGEPLLAAGASRISVVTQSGLPQSALDALGAVAGGTVVLALGSPLAHCLQGLITIALSPKTRGTGESSTIDLALGVEPDPVAARIGEWLAAALRAPRRRGA